MFGIPVSMIDISMLRYANVLQRMDNLVPCSGCDEMAGNGMNIHVPLQLEAGTFPSFNGRQQMDVPTGTGVHVVL